MRGILKWPLVIAAIVVVARVALERTGAPLRVSGLFSVVALYLLICPLYFAFRIGGSDIARPYRTLLMTTALYAALARAMVIPTYWLAYIYQWPEPRFATNQGGVVGPGVKPLLAYVAIPLGAALAWILGSVIIGGGLGSIVDSTSSRTAAMEMRGTARNLEEQNLMQMSQVLESSKSAMFRGLRRSLVSVVS